MRTWSAAIPDRDTPHLDDLSNHAQTWVTDKIHYLFSSLILFFSYDRRF
jgi:hypothetical protein